MIGSGIAPRRERASRDRERARAEHDAPRAGMSSLSMSVIGTNAAADLNVGAAHAASRSTMARFDPAPVAASRSTTCKR